MGQKAKRLEPKLKTLRELFLKSGNLCAFPGCAALMMNAQGLFIGHVCHIEAAERSGERFNEDMSNEDRRHASNLMLMCPPHHQETNDVVKFPVAKLREMKTEHEGRFSHPDRAIRDTLIDRTRGDGPKAAKTLARLGKELAWASSADELQEMATELKTYAMSLARVPVDVRLFLGAVAMRVVRASKSEAVRNSPWGTWILANDVRDALHLEEGLLYERIDQLSVYHLGDLDGMDTDSGEKPAIRLRDLRCVFRPS